jgi:hypothetical protein
MDNVRLRRCASLRMHLQQRRQEQPAWIGACAPWRPLHAESPYLLIAGSRGEENSPHVDKVVRRQGIYCSLPNRGTNHSSTWALIVVFDFFFTAMLGVNYSSSSREHLYPQTFVILASAAV